MPLVTRILSRSFGLHTLVALAVASGAAPIRSETLAGAVDQALAASPEVAEAVNLWRARQEEVEGARAGFRPRVDLTAGFGYEYTDSPGSRALGQDSIELDRGEFGVSARQLLFDGFGTASELARQEARVASAAAGLRAVAESVAAKTAVAYVDLLRYRELEQLSGDSLQVHLRIQDQIRLRSDAGVGRRADLDQVDARVALAQANVIAAQVNRADAETGYRRVVGRFPPSEAARPQVTVERLPVTVDEAIELAKLANPQILGANADIEAAQESHRAAKQFNYPRLELEVGSNLDNNIDGAEGYRNEVEAMLRMRYNLYRGGADAAKVRETAYNITESKEVRNRAYRQLEEALRLAWAALDATTRQVPLLEAQIVAARATRDAYAKQFNIGQRTLIDLLNSENEVLAARQAVVNAASDRLLAYYRVLEAMGRLVEHFGSETPVVATAGN
ncbi:MAG: TolC family outer membrane protein [Gammaproteobacteria bacterium]